jgi:hypothetical protein
VPPIEAATTAATAPVVASGRLYNDCYSCAASLTDDFEAYPDGVSLGGMIAAQRFSELDRELVAAMEHPECLVALGQPLAVVDPVRFEALAHAWPTDARAELAGKAWAADALARWDEVEREPRSPRQLFLVATHEELDDLARCAYTEMTGSPYPDPELADDSFWVTRPGGAG